MEDKNEQNILNNKINDIMDIYFPKFKESILKDLTNEKLNKEKEIFNSNSEEIEKKQHSNLICSNCFKTNFEGYRYICCECDNFNLCEDCEEKKCQNYIYHNSNHVFLRIYEPIDLDINKYNNLIEGNNQILELINGVALVKISVINTGVNSLKDCFIRPICFGNPYIGGKKITIDKDIERNEKIDLIIKIENNKEYNQDVESKQFISTWRMFTKEGIPFGNVISFCINKIL
jgi:hypothetical protein